MKRKDIADIIASKYPCFAIGTNKGECTKPYAVLKYDTQLNSVRNIQCGWQYIHIFCYVPKINILELDDMVEDVVTLLKDKLEFTGEITQDLLEEEKQAFSRRLKFRIPKEVI